MLAEVDPEPAGSRRPPHRGWPRRDPEPPPWLATELERLRREPDIDVRRQRFRELFTRAVGDCSEMRAHVPFLFGRDPAVPPSAAPTISLRDAMIACRCGGVETDAVVAIGILTGPPNRHPLRVLSFRRATAPGERVIDASAIETVASFVDRLAASRDPLRVWLGEPAPSAEPAPEGE
ncbi:MAG: hypothetical protein R3B82_28990 [Sandaracinaceae bacterium]